MRQLVIDGYNVIHAWPALKKALVEHGLEASRRQLVTALAAYAARSGAAITVVFDAHSREERREPVETVDGVTVRYGTRTQSADHVIERLASQSSRGGSRTDMVVVTGDRLQRALVGGMGVATMSPAAFEEEVALVAAEVTRDAARARADAHAARRVEHHLSPEVLRRLEALRRGEALDERP